MNGHRDIERTLDAWFVDGPMVMPDRLFDAVLDQVERVPQRRLARLSLRYAEMNPRIRLFTVLAAAMLLVVAALALIGGGSQGLVPATPTPSPAASQALTDLPAELTNRYNGPLRAVESLQTGTVARLRIDQRSFAYDNGSQRLLQSRAGLDGDDLVLVSTTSVGCQEGDEGRYPYSTSTGGSTLTIEAGTDECAVRLAALVGPWQRVGCRNPDPAWCLGVVEAGTYRSQYFDPTATTSAVSRPDFGRLSWTVPDGWANEGDEPSRYGFMRAAAYLAGGVNVGANPPDNIALLARASAAALHAGCPEEPESGVGTDSAALSAWLIAHPGLDVTQQPAITIDGLEATVLDIRMDAAWTETCDPDNPFVAAPLFVGDYHWAIAQNDRMRLIVLDLPSGTTVVIDIDPNDPATFDQFLSEAMPIVESFDFK